MQTYDRSAKWLIQHHGDSILRLAGIEDVVGFKPLQAEVVQPRQLPDGLIEATREGRAEPELFVVEIATYPEARIVEQVARDAMLVLLARRRLPDCLVLILHPKGSNRPLDEYVARSGADWTRLSIRWRTVALWTIAAEDLLGEADVGLVPWAMLTKTDLSPERLAERCADRIKVLAPTNEIENLLAVSQVLSRLRYNDPRVFAALGGSKTMIESPLIREIVADTRHKDIMRVLRHRFGRSADEVVEPLAGVEDPLGLDELFDQSLVCAGVKEFLSRVQGLKSQSREPGHEL